VLDFIEFLKLKEKKGLRRNPLITDFRASFNRHINIKLLV